MHNSLKHIKSLQLLERAKQVTPLGAQTYSKSYRYFCEGISPCFIERGQGCYVWDIDGNQYIDFICALGPITIGYNDSRVNEAIIKQLEKGIIFSQPSPISVELAEKLIQIIPCAEMVRFVKNGSDATTAAVKLSRAYTGREMVAVCGYHGMQDWYIGATENNKGVPKAVSELTKFFSYNNIDSLLQLFELYKDKIAAVILEPVQGNGPKDNFLEEVKRITHENGAVLIFDEVKSGFWYALGGASEYFGVTPDMATFGKGMANGMPISVVAGRREIMELIGTKGVFISTTFGGEALSMAAALATIEILETENAYDHIWKIGYLMLDGIKKLTQKYDLNKIVNIKGLAPYCGAQFVGVNSLDYLDITSIYQQKMTEYGILALELNHINLSHTQKEITLFLEAFEKGLIYIKQAIAQDSLDGILNGEKVDPIFKRTL